MLRLAPVLFLLACADGAAPGGTGDPRCHDGVCPERLRDAQPDARGTHDAAVDGPTPDVKHALPDVAADGPLADGAAPDMPDASPDAAVDADLDAAVPDPDALVVSPDAFVSPPDVFVPPPDVFVPPPDAAPEPDMALEPDAFAPPPTPPRGIYEYERLQIGGLTTPWRVAFHPDGDYFVVLENTGEVHVVDWVAEESVTFDPAPRGTTLFWEDLEFDPSGDFALLVGSHDRAAGVVYRFDDAAYRAGGADVVAELPGLQQAGAPIVSVKYPWDGGAPVVLSKVDVGAAWNARLRDIDLDGAAYGELFVAHFSSAGCDDLAFANNEFGGPGMLLVCGDGGADFLYYTEVGGRGEWRIRPGTNNTGNLGSASAHPLGDYALVVAWSGRRVFRFQAGVLNTTRDAPNYSRQGITRVVFQQAGQRALIVGRAGVAPVRGTVIEYRHDEYVCPVVDAQGCGLTNVSIPAFDAPPYNGDGNTHFNDAAFRPGCDGGIIVGNQRNGGYIIRFDIANGRACP